MPQVKRKRASLLEGRNPMEWRPSETKRQKTDLKGGYSKATDRKSSTHESIKAEKASNDHDEIQVARVKFKKDTSDERQTASSPSEEKRYLATFYTSGAIHINFSSPVCMVITGIMFDGHASANLISRELVKELRLHPLNVASETSGSADSRSATYDQTVCFPLCIAGVVSQLEAYVEDGKTEHPFVIGKPGRKQFRVMINDAYGVGKDSRMKVTVAWDETGDRRLRYIVPEDKPEVKPGFEWVRVEHERVRRLRTGYTTGQLARGEKIS